MKQQQRIKSVLIIFGFYYERNLKKTHIIHERCVSSSVMNGNKIDYRKLGSLFTYPKNKFPQRITRNRYQSGSFFAFGLFVVYF